MLFSLASTKLPHYILYGVTPLVILMARYRYMLTSRWLAAAFPVILFGLLTAFPLLIPYVEATLTNPIEIATAQRAHTYFDAAFTISVAIASLVAIGIIFWRRISPWFALVVTGVIQSLVVWFLFVPTYSDTQQLPVYEAAMFARTLDEPVITQSVDLPSFNVYLDKVTERRALEAGEVGFAREDRVDSVGQFDTLFKSGPIMIIRKTADEPAQETSGEALNDKD